MSIHWYPERDDAALAIPDGDVAGQTSVNKFGRNTAVGTGGEDIWDSGDTWVAPTAARPHVIHSDDAGDTLSASGAWTLQVYGLQDWASKETSEVITLNGTTDVTTSSSYVIIHRMKVLTSGGIINEGSIGAVAQIDLTTTAAIKAGQGQTQMAVYGIPSTQSAFLTGFYGSILGNPTAGANLDLLFAPQVNETSGTGRTAFQVKHSIGIANGGSTAVQHHYNPYNKFSGPGIFKIKATPTLAADISAGFDLILKDN